MLTPLADNIIVTIDAIETTTESGLYIPESAVKAPQTAKVVSVSKDNDKVAPGDQLLIRQYAGQPFEFGDENLHLIHTNDIIAIIN